MTSHVETFRTNRLVAERMCAEDLDTLCRMNQDPRVMATLGGLRSAEQTRQFLSASLDHWDRHGYGLWMFRDSADRQFVGRGGLRRIEITGNLEVELAYALMAEYWGRGLATEMAQAIVDLGFRRLGLKEIVCFTLPTNRASQRVMEKVGFSYERDIVHAGLPHVFYRLRIANGLTDVC
jgi:ribosomal-protein-alanine N-acetyltransferase